MKPSSLRPALLAATLFILGSGLRAEEPAGAGENAMQEPGAMSPKRHQELLKRFDKNGDGKLDEDEKAAAKAANLEAGEGRRAKAAEVGKKVIAKFDKNGDGKLDEAERAEAANAIANDPRAIRRFDKDKDGKLNDEEKAAAREALMQARAKRAKGEKE